MRAYLNNTGMTFLTDMHKYWGLISRCCPFTYRKNWFNPSGGIQTTYENGDGSEHPKGNMLVEGNTSWWCLCLWSAGIAHPATWQPGDMQEGFSISEMQWNGGGRCSQNCLSFYEALSSGFYLTFIQSNILTIWTNKQKMILIFDPGRPSMKKSSAACAMSLKYPSLPETYVACFPGCGKSYHFQSTKSPFSLCTHTSPSPTLHRVGVKGNIILNCYTVTCQRGEDACAPNTLCCACFWEVLYLQSLYSGAKEK